MGLQQISAADSDAMPAERYAAGVRARRTVRWGSRATAQNGLQSIASTRDRKNAIFETPGVGKGLNTKLTLTERGLTLT